jgi:hypothetical protein
MDLKGTAARDFVTRSSDGSWRNSALGTIFGHHGGSRLNPHSLPTPAAAAAAANPELETQVSLS